jgi:AcrR family transcriptional regulator
VPRRAQSPEAFQARKQQILQIATTVISSEGFEALTMRRLARSADMTAANLYNYYANKNELYLAIQMRGFEQLLSEFASAAQKPTDPLDQLEAFVRAYVAFGRDNPETYDVMLGRNTPKYADYVGTPDEPAASAEKRAAMAVIELAESVLQAAADARGVDLPHGARLLTMQVWSTLHGVVSLLNARVIQEVIDAPDDLIDSIVADARARFLSESNS